VPIFLHLLDIRILSSHFGVYAASPDCIAVRAEVKVLSMRICGNAASISRTSRKVQTLSLSKRTSVSSVLRDSARLRSRHNGRVGERKAGATRRQELAREEREHEKLGSPLVRSEVETRVVSSILDIYKTVHTVVHTT
jgi:hypothetical protein